MKQINNDYSFQKISLGVLLLLFCCHFCCCLVFLVLFFKAIPGTYGRTSRKLQPQKKSEKKEKMHL